jgi:hypothetical protein
MYTRSIDSLATPAAHTPLPFALCVCSRRLAHGARGLAKVLAVARALIKEMPHPRRHTGVSDDCTSACPDEDVSVP